jgi:hypothetical protein
MRSHLISWWFPVDHPGFSGRKVENMLGSPHLAGARADTWPPHAGTSTGQLGWGCRWTFAPPPGRRPVPDGARQRSHRGDQWRNTEMAGRSARAFFGAAP